MLRFLFELLFQAGSTIPKFSTLDHRHLNLCYDTSLENSFSLLEQLYLTLLISHYLHTWSRSFLTFSQVIFDTWGLYKHEYLLYFLTCTFYDFSGLIIIHYMLRGFHLHVSTQGPRWTKASPLNNCKWPWQGQGTLEVSHGSLLTVRELYLKLYCPIQ